MRNYSILEIKRTGTFYKDGHGRKVENAHSEQRATETGKNGGEALQRFLDTLPPNKRGQVYKMGSVWIATNERGITTYTAQAI